MSNKHYPNAAAILPKGKTIWLVEVENINKSWPGDVSIQCPSTVDFVLNDLRIVSAGSGYPYQLFKVDFTPPYPQYQGLEICRFYGKGGDIQFLAEQFGPKSTIMSSSVTVREAVTPNASRLALDA